MSDNVKGLLAHNESVNRQITGYLQDALILLLEKKSFEEITITELCQKAGVSRMAFYGNYRTKEDLFNQIVCELNKDLVEIVGSPFFRTTGLDWYLHFFTVLAQNADTLKTVVSADRNGYLSAINSVVLNTRPLTDKQRYLRTIWTGGMVNVTLYWIDCNMDKSVEEIAAYCYNSLNRALSDYPNS